MGPQVYFDCLKQATERGGLNPSDLQAATFTDIQTVEKLLGRALDVQYQEFLHLIGCGQVFGGLACWPHLDVLAPGNVIELSRRMEVEAREASGKNATPKDFLVIYDARDGDLMGFMPSRNGGYQPGIWAWDTFDLELRQVSADFAGFLAYLASDCDLGES